MNASQSSQRPHAQPAEQFQGLVGKRIIAVEQAPKADEGLVLRFEDGTWLDIGFSFACGSIECFNAAPGPRTP